MLKLTLLAAIAALALTTGARAAAEITLHEVKADGQIVLWHLSCDAIGAYTTTDFMQYTVVVNGLVMVFQGIGTNKTLDECFASQPSHH